MKRYKIYAYYEIPISRGKRLYAWTTNKDISELFESQRNMDAFICKKKEINASDIRKFEIRYPSERLDEEPVTTKKSILNSYIKGYVPLVLTLNETIKINSDEMHAVELGKIVDNCCINLREYLKPTYNDALDILGFGFITDWLKGKLTAFRDGNTCSMIKEFDDFETFCRLYSWSVPWGRE